MQTILVTGASGYLGSHLLDHLRRQPVTLHATYRTQHPEMAGTTWHLVDLRQPVSTTELVQLVQPSQIYHLAGNIRAGRTHADSLSAWQDNLHATLHLYEACLKLSFKPRIVFVSSGAIYGQQLGLITEETLLAPLSPYAASKAAADLVSYQYATSQSLPIIRARLFNYLGPGLGSETALGRFTHELVRLERLGSQPAVLETGSLDAERDYLHIRDVVSGLTFLMDGGNAGEAYHLASGNSLTMRWSLEQLLSHIRIPVTIRQLDQQRAEAMTLQVSSTKLRSLGWNSTITIENGLREMIDYGRQHYV
jgi:GDP-4-dehydro-6-deoxy-D-mannose reductase